ncbi:hypothetical protein LCGC14_1313820 [marine sediment metagenome]|uniref:Uncharacterized protein n=1 Tax=marine sediment metagenome TaxID=412755 RepID=A0A0F9L6N0_9ZZZZ
MKELAKHPYPPCVELWVLYWVSRAREPTIVRVDKFLESEIERQKGENKK